MAQAQKAQTQFESIEQEIEWHRENGSNILIPFTKLEPSEFHMPVIDEVHLSIEQGDAYQRKDAKGNIKYALSFQGLNRLGVCAGVQWHPYETRRTDNGADRLYIAFRAVGGVKKADGSMVWHAANYDLDLEVIREEIEEQHRNKSKNWNKSLQEKDAYVEHATARDWRQKRRHKHALAESGAKARVLRSLLGVKGLYTEAELKKPFVVVRYIFQPPTDDPNVRRQLINQSMASMRSVYGSALPHYPEKDDYIDVPPPKEATEVPPEGEGADPDPPPADPPPPEPDPEPEPGAAREAKQQGMSSGSPDPDKGQDQRIKDFQAKSKAKQLVEITRLAREVKYDLVAIQTNEGVRVDQLSDERRLELYKDILARKK